MIELGAWYDGDEESNVAIVGANSETEPIYNRNEVSTLICRPLLLGYGTSNTIVYSESDYTHRFDFN